MTLTDIFKTLPAEMILKSHVNRVMKTAAEWATEMKMEKTTGYKVHDSSRNYGKDSIKVIYYPGVGMCFSEVQ